MPNSQSDSVSPRPSGHLASLSAASAPAIFDLLQQHCSDLDLSHIDRFIRYSRHLKQEIVVSFMASGFEIAPITLPRHVLLFLHSALSIPTLLLEALWDTLKGHIWSLPNAVYLTDEDCVVFQTYGTRSDRVRERIASVMFYPPCHSCTRCGQKMSLNDGNRHEVLYYTRAQGLRAGYTTSLRCRKSTCRTVYHHNFYVSEGTRCYYESVIDAIQIEDHVFVESSLAELFTALMLFAWVSNQNCAHIYNDALASSLVTVPIDWTSTRTEELDGRQVWRAFSLNALLREANERNSPLVLPENAKQDDRLKFAMEQRTAFIAEHGQPHRMHACTVCEKEMPSRADGQPRLVRAVVSDGISLGYKRCRFRGCKEPLTHHRLRFCPTHKDLEKICIIPGCGAERRTKHDTCSKPEHADHEAHIKLKNTSASQLRERLKRANISQTTDSVDMEEIIIPDDLSDDEDNDEDSRDGVPEPTTRLVPSKAAARSSEPVVPGAKETGASGSSAYVGGDPAADKSPQGNRARKPFQRAMTHNQQTVVTGCGMCLARATFHDSEGVVEVKEFWKSSRCWPKQSMLPQAIMYDNACNELAHLVAQDDDYFQSTMLCVDVFHFKCKHKTTDAFCQANCNPAFFSELLDGDKWVFNSSAAEQVNVWLGGYLAMTREMLAYRFEFFLDEMIKRRNEKLVARLQREGKCPYVIPV